MDELIAELWRRGLFRVVDESEVWTHRGAPVLNGLFGVPKPTRPEKQVVVDGISRDLQRLICHLVPSNSLQRRLEGDLETLPHTGQWDSVHLLAY